jgi:hypothetical protein
MRNGIPLRKFAGRLRCPKPHCTGMSISGKATNNLSAAFWQCPPVHQLLIFSVSSIAETTRLEYGIKAKGGEH